MTGGVGANPNDFLPALAANVMGLEQFAATTIEEWEAQIRGGVVTASAFLQTAINDLASKADAATDQIAALLDGLFGTGHAIQDLVNYLQSIPGSVINGFTAIEQQIIDTIANALGHAGTGYSLANLLTFLGLIPGANITGALNTAVTISGTAVGTLLQNLDSTGKFAAAALTGALNSAVTIAGNPIGTVLQFLDASGQFDASQLTGGINTAVTFGGTALSTLLQNLTAGGEFAASALTGALNTAVTISGTAIGTLLQYLNSSGQFNAAQLTGALNSAVTVAGTAIGTLLQNLNSSGQLLGSAITGAVSAALISGTTTAQQTLQDALNQALNPLASLNASAATVAAQMQTSLQGLLPAVVQNANGTATALSNAVITINNNGTATYNQVANSVQTLVDQANGTMASVAQSFQSAAQAAISQAGSNFTAAAANVQGLINGLFGGFGIGAGAAAPASTPDQATQAVIAAQQSIADNAAGLAALNALLNQAQNGGGTSVSVNFTTYADGALPASFTGGLSGAYSTITFPGTPTVSGGYAIDNAGVNTSFNGVGAIYNSATTVGDQQLITGIFTDSGVRALVGRSNSAGTSYVICVNTGSGAWVLFCVVAGTYTYLNSVSDTFTPGAAYSLVCGTGASANRNYQILKNGTPLTWTVGGGTTFTESGTTSQMGASYRYCGFGLDSPAKLSQWTFADNAPPAAVGSGFRANKTGTGSVSISNGTNILPSSFFDSVEYITSDLTHDSTNNKITVSVSGWYEVRISLWVNSGTSTAGIGPAVFKNGSLNQIGTAVTIGSAFLVANTFNVYCAAGDTIQAGTYTSPSASASLVGANSDATRTNWSVAFANRGTLS